MYSILEPKTTKEIYNDIIWSIRCQQRNGANKVTWGETLWQYKQQYPKIFKAANETYWSTK